MTIMIDTIESAGLQTRVEINEDVVSEYAEVLREGGTFPPIVLYTTDPKSDLLAKSVYFLADGFHRLEAAKRLGRFEIEAEVREGDRTAALKAALKANAAHGLRRTNADKRHALELAWENRRELFGADPSSRELAAVCAVSARSAAYFLEDMKVCNLHTPDSSTPTLAAAKRSEAGADRFGLPIPDHLQAALKSKALAKMSRVIRSLAAEIVRERERGNYVFAKVSQSSLITLSNAAANLKLETPYCVCPNCRGAGCRACGKTGLQTKMEYERNPREVREA